MLVLIIDTSGDTCRLILARDEVVVSERDWEATKDTGRQVLNRLDEMLGETGVSKTAIDRIAVQAGPGRRYSSLRAGITIGSILALTLEADLVSVKSVDSAEMVSEALSLDSVKVVEPIYAE